MKTAVQFHEQLTEAVKVSSQDIRKHTAMAIGAVGHQGDVYVHRIKDIPAAWDVAVTEHRQVALGATIGSRHIAEGDGLTVLWPKSVEAAIEECPVKKLVQNLGNGARFCLGPIVKADKAWTLTHPEHAHHEFPAGNYLVTYQLDFSRQRQVRD
jgi:hypothetical protein